MFENPRRGRQAKKFTTNVPKILDLKSSSEQIFFRKLSFGAPVNTDLSELKWSSLSVTVAALHVPNRHSLSLSFNGAHVAVQWINVGPSLGQEFAL